TTPTPTGHQTLTIHTRTTTTWTTHATATLSPDEPTVPAEIGIWPPAGEPVDIDALYPLLAAKGYHYGPSFQNLRRAWRAGSDVYAEVELPDDLRPDGHAVHPALADAALHALIAVAVDDLGTAPRVPYSFSGVAVHANLATSVRARLTAIGDGAYQVLLADPAGHPVLSIDRLDLRDLDPATLPVAAAPGTELLHRLDWQELRADAAPPADPAGWAVLGTPGPALHGALPGLRQVPDLAALLYDELPDVVFLSCRTPRPDETPADAPAATTDDPVAAAHELTEALLHSLQQWLAEERLAGTRLVITTEGGVAAHLADQIADLAAAACWGLTRSAQAEHPDRFVLLDLDGRPTDPSVLAAALAAAEPHLAVRFGVAYVDRLVRCADDPARLTPPDENWRFGTTSAGTLANVAMVPAPEALRPLRDGEVRVRTHATGLNFRDVLIALGSYPGEAPLGSEGAGVVVETGPGVTGLDPGDRVMGLFSEGTGPLAVCDHHLLTRTPDHLSDSQAAVLPIAYLTAMYGLGDLAGLRAGQSVLIHTATGGVGMAALHYARHLGATVHTTASIGKQPTLSALGVPDSHIHDSRTTAYREGIAAVAPQGVDVVLNSLTQAHVDAGLALLAQGGTFLEIGKTDIRDPHTVTTTHPHLTYQPYDLLDAGP
ncbi:polyketide synthase dehydratase domain-containing protein, partial [Micromonospora sp. NPDC048894]|uniref:polyketide synthase dehydratase domain-containing protein n=1 Tax=unclassified Micromonospora TaxID=2617518 RepID=UPI0033E77B9E